jgi:chromate transporter
VWRSLREVAGVFLRLGCLSFGGPVAHLGFIRAACVEQRRWVDDAQYADVVALCQFLPGPASSQVVFALGMLRAGLAGALVASVCFLVPSAVFMIAAAIGLAHVNIDDAGWLHGLKLVAVAVVAQAVWSMGKKLCPDTPRRVLGVAAAVATVLLPSAPTQTSVIALGALLGWWHHRRSTTDEETGTTKHSGAPNPAAVAALVAFAVLLAGLPVLSQLSSWREVEIVDRFYRAGAMVFGGGHVVLPLLRSAVDDVVSDRVFLAGYGLAQAVPGLLFSFAGFLGAALFPAAPWTGGALCLLAIFLPAWLLVGGALPFWRSWRRRPGAQAALVGANAAVVGVLLGALYTPLSSIRSLGDVVVVAGALVLLQRWQHPWLVLLLCAAVCEVLMR